MGSARFPNASFFFFHDVGNEAGRDCSGRGVCDYEFGECRCFAGFGGEECSIIIQYS